MVTTRKLCPMLALAFYNGPCTVHGTTTGHKLLEVVCTSALTYPLRHRLLPNRLFPNLLNCQDGMRIKA